VAEEIEEKTRYQNYTGADIERWRREGLLSKQDIEALGFSPRIKTFIQAMEEYRESWDVSLKEEASRESRLKVIASILGEQAPLKALRYSDGLKLRNELKGRGYKTATIQKCIQDLKRCLNLQLANRSIEYNPFATLSGGRVPEHEKPNQKALTDTEVSEIIGKADGSELLGGWLKIFLLMFFGCGLRRSEAMDARWENVNWEERSLLLTRTKTHTPRKVGLGKLLYYELIMRRKDEGLIFPAFHPDTVSKAIKKHLDKCGIKMRQHDMRHTYATLIQQKAGAKPIEAMARTGHRDMRMLSLYSHGKFDRIFEDELEFMKVPEGQASKA